ncbi:unnamed protein product [Euphydryas editha]|uniref:Uncharacterized protein n=1 Tax=Euphydryas editha TaxID=104508 RepID=A0AAU9UIU5_EUPED|nr:unnamed protein product [Euphydryas editha]
MCTRRNILEKDDDIIEMPKSVEDLPRAEPIKPGHTLIQPSLGMLESAVKYPQKDVSGTAVYGNLKNLGLTYGKTNQRLSYGSFRKSNLIRHILEKDGDIVETPKSVEDLQKVEPGKYGQTSAVYENMKNLGLTFGNTNERLSHGSFRKSKDLLTRRKSNKRKKSKYRNRDSTASSSSEASSSSSDDSSDYESNPGNPFTVHKDKYKQNWLWNHFMDGDHMNVNPYAPQFSSGGPSGASLFFGRKWWYFNQDDYKPLQ